MRLADEVDFGFDVEECARNEFVVANVRDQGAAARAHITPGQRVVKFRPHVVGEYAQKKLVSNRSWLFQPWNSKSLETINALPREQAIAIKLLSADKIPDESSERSKLIERTKKKVSAHVALVLQDGGPHSHDCAWTPSALQL